MPKANRTIPTLFAFLCLVVTSDAKVLRVFILAGQSNMEGKAKMSLLEYQATAPATKQLFAHLRSTDASNESSSWIERDDVSIKFLDRHGKLTVGYGSRNCIGPELEFGWTMGDHFADPVLLIKTAWGGKSLYRDFRPPSSELPDDDVLQAILERQQKRKPKTTIEDVKSSFGHYYREMLKEVHSTLENRGELFSDYKDLDYEIAGFVWFQGWNDMVNPDYTAAYTTNMANFIRDVRKDLKKPTLPFVIGQLGVGGTKEDIPSLKPNPKRDAFKKAQAAAGEEQDFKNNVVVVKTDQYWDMEADAVFKKGWKENLEAWNKVGSDRPYHYLGSAKCYSQMGEAFAESLLEILPSTKAFYDPIEKQVEGWTIKVDPVLLADEHEETRERAFEALANHLQRVKYIVPKDRLDQLIKLPIWLELANSELSSMQYHPSRGWLIANGHDPRLVKHVHIPHAKALFDPKMWAKHPYVVLHELAHSYHDQILSFDNEEVINVFDAAKDAGIYEEVLLYTGKKVRHYGLNNHKEYFAESTEAYFGVNDFYPFVRAELKEHDPRMFELMRKIWGEVR